MAKSKVIKACMVCASTNLDSLPGGADSFFTKSGFSTLSGMSHCRNCGETRVPLEFDSEESYKEFVKSKKNRRATR
ncbi:Uncharacterised protein [Candidatus Gugararchaeum adminiculabundum]|nr:Uncharacterised protein [Candidatus Gugararchaeum adminiculabundum]